LAVDHLKDQASHLSSLPCRTSDSKGFKQGLVLVQGD
jgi:hypothetical protein